MGNSILLVDDDDAVRASLRRVLKREKYEVIEASSGEEGLAVVKSRPVDIVISDYQMPTMTGLDFLRAVLVVRPDVLRILLTGNADLDMAVRAINEGLVYRFLQKPWNQLDVTVMLRLALNHQESERRNARLLDIVKRQARFLERLSRDQPELFSVDRDENGAILIADEELALLEA
jgi:DNA-binding NtrC family response regulator